MFHHLYKKRSILRVVHHNARTQYRSNRNEYRIDRIEKRKIPLLKELSQTSLDSFESESDSKESRDVRLNSFKNSIFHFCHFWANSANRPGILSNRIPIRKNPRKIGLIPSKVAFRNFCVFLISNRSNISKTIRIDRIDRKPPWY